MRCGYRATTENAVLQPLVRALSLPMQFATQARAAGVGFRAENACRPCTRACARRTATFGTFRGGFGRATLLSPVHASYSPNTRCAYELTGVFRVRRRKFP